MRRAPLFLLLTLALASLALAAPVPKILKAVLKNAQNDTIYSWDNSTGTPQVVDNADVTAIDGAVANTFYIDMRVKNAGDAPLDGYAYGFYYFLNPRGDLESPFNTSNIYSYTAARLFPGEERELKGFYATTLRRRMPGRWRVCATLFHQNAANRNDACMNFRIQDYPGYGYNALSVTMPRLDNQVNPSAFSAQAADGSFSVTVRSTVQNTGTLPLEGPASTSCYREPWYRGANTETQKYVYPGTVPVSPGGSVELTHAFTLTPGYWTCRSDVASAEILGSGYKIGAIVYSPRYDALIYPASFVNKFYLGPTDSLVVTVPVIVPTFGGTMNDFTPTEPLTLTLRLYDARNQVLYENTRTVDDLKATNDWYNPKLYNFTINLDYANLLNIVKAEQTLASTPGLAARAPYLPAGKLLDLKRNTLEVARLIRADNRNEWNLHLPLGGTRLFDLLLRNTQPGSPVGTPTNYQFTATPSKTTPFQVTPSNKIYQIPPATSQSFGERTFPQEVTLSAPAGGAWASEGGLCPNVRYDLASTSTTDYRSTDHAYVSAAALPDTLQRELVLGGPGGRALAWQGPGQATLSEGAAGLGTVTYSTTDPALARWSASASVENPTRSCTNYLCCVEGFCTQAAFDSMMAFFKEQASIIARATAFRRGSAVALPGGERPFEYSTIAQVGPGVTLAGSGVTLTGGDACPGAAAYLVKARTSDGQAWTYNAQLLSVRRNDGLQGYGGQAALPGDVRLCGLADLGHSLTSCDARPAILDGANYKNIGGTTTG